jgi:solute carrier family 45 protein 1/2/4
LEEVGMIPIRERSSSGTRNGERGRGEEEQRFLVGADEEEEEEGEREGEREGGMPGVMGNGDASGRAQHDDVSGGGLSAKAGIILVGFPLL